MKQISVRKGMWSLAWVLTFASLTGCEGTGTAEGVMAKAGKAIQQNDLRGLRESLAGGALAAYGTPAGLQNLRAELLKYSNLQGSRPEEIDSVPGPHGDTLNRYRANVRGLAPGQGLRALYELTIDCETEYFYEPSMCGRNPPVGGPWNPPGAPMPGDPHCWTGTRECRIVDIR
jgi:hypothetical protein